jgi:hypothetical protein
MRDGALEQPKARTPGFASIEPLSPRGRYAKSAITPAPKDSMAVE